MNGKLRHVTAAGLLLAFWGAMLAVGWVQRYQAADIRLVIENRLETTRFVRVFDGPSDALVAIFRVEPDTRTVLHHRPNAWWNQLTGEERARGREAGLRIELVTGACGLLASETADHWDARLILSHDLGGLSRDDAEAPGPKLRTVSAADAAVPDPCRGAAPRPIALVRNLEPVAVILGGRLRIEACSSRVVASGDLATILPVATTQDARRVSLTSLDVQRGRWPLGIRTVTVSLQPDDAGVLVDVVDEWGGSAMDEGQSSEECPTVHKADPPQ